MTFHSTEPVPRSAPGTGAGVKTFVTAVLLTFGVGLLGMVGWAVLSSGFGGFLGLVAGVFGVVWWRSIHDKTVFPQVIPTKSVVILAVVNAVLALVLILTAG